jgi:hypothetical protein
MVRGISATRAGRPVVAKSSEQYEKEIHHLTILRAAIRQDLNLSTEDSKRVAEEIDTVVDSLVQILKDAR